MPVIQPREVVGWPREAEHVRGGPVHDGHGLPGQPVDLVDGAVDLLAAGGLFLGGGGDGAHLIAGALGQGQNIFQGLAGVRGAGGRFLHGQGGFGHLRRGGLGALLDGADDGADLLGGAHGLLGQFAHFVGDHGKAPARVARPGRLDGRVQRQQIGLVRNVVDDVHHLADAVGPGAEVRNARGQGFDDSVHAADLLHKAMHALRALARFAAGVRGLLGGAGGVGGDLQHGGVHCSMAAAVSCMRSRWEVASALAFSMREARSSAAAPTSSEMTPHWEAMAAMLVFFSRTEASPLRSR
jgi:hypothetical protein